MKTFSQSQIKKAANEIFAENVEKLHQEKDETETGKAAANISFLSEQLALNKLLLKLGITDIIK
jgi:D-Tyr-tRNAtyr deacylase